MNILCYCEANKKTGLGHFSRIKILIKLLKKKNPNTIFYIFSKNLKLAKKYFYNYKIINTKKNLLTHLTYYNNFYNLVILDPPYYEKGKHTKEENLKDIYFIKNKNFQILKLTDETAPSKHYCDYLINDYPLSVNFKKKYKQINNKIKLFLGIYAFLYPIQKIKKFLDLKKKYDILIVFGGSDPKNLLIRYFKVFKNIKKKKIFILNKKALLMLKKFEDSYNTLKPLMSQNLFIKTLSTSKNYVSTPSNIMFEAFSLNINGTVIPTQNRQKNMGKSFEKLKIAKCLPIYTKLKDQILRNSLKKKIKIQTKFNIKKAIRMQNKIGNIL